MKIRIRPYFPRIDIELTLAEWIAIQDHVDEKIVGGWLDRFPQREMADFMHDMFFFKNELRVPSNNWSRLWEVCSRLRELMSVDEVMSVRVSLNVNSIEMAKHLITLCQDMNTDYARAIVSMLTVTCEADYQTRIYPEDDNAPSN